MSKESFSERIFKRLIEDYKDYEQSRGILGLVTMFVDEYKKREKLEKDIKEVLAPYFNEKTGAMPEDTVEAVKQFVKNATDNVQIFKIEIPATDEAPDALLIEKLLNEYGAYIKIFKQGK